MSVKNEACVSLELVDLPMLRLDLVKDRFDHAIAHGSLESDWTWGRKDLTHEVKLLFGHRLGPRSDFGGSFFLSRHG